MKTTLTGHRVVKRLDYSRGKFAMTSGMKCAGIGCHLRSFIQTSNIDADDIRMFEDAAAIKVYKRGEEIFRQNQKSTGIYCVRSGQLLLWRLDEFGYETAFRVVTSGEIIGYRSFFGGEPHAATARALSSCNICFTPAAMVTDLVDAYPLLGQHFLKVLARDRGPPDGLLLRGQQLPLRVRLINLLLLLKDGFSTTASDGSLIFQLPLLRRDIAALLGTRPESVTRLIKELKNENIAVFQQRNVIVPAPERLYEITRVVDNRRKLAY